MCRGLFQSLIPLPLRSTVTHVFLSGSWGQEGKLPGLPPPPPPLGAILRSPQGRWSAPSSPLLLRGELCMGPLEAAWTGKGNEGQR